MEVQVLSPAFIEAIILWVVAFFVVGRIFYLHIEITFNTIEMKTTYKGGISYGKNIGVTASGIGAADHRRN